MKLLPEVRLALAFLGPALTETLYHYGTLNIS